MHTISNSSMSFGREQSPKVIAYILKSRNHCIFSSGTGLDELQEESCEAEGNWYMDPAKAGSR